MTVLKLVLTLVAVRFAGFGDSAADAPARSWPPFRRSLSPAETNARSYHSLCSGATAGGRRGMPFRAGGR